MKTTIRKTAVLATVLFACILSTAFIGARHTPKKELKKAPPSISCTGPYAITNNSSCTLQVRYTLMCGTTPCFTSGMITLIPSSTHNVPPGAFSCLSTCSGGCDIRVDVFYNTSLLGSVNSTHPTSRWLKPGCVPSGSIVWTTTNTTIS